MQAIKYIQTPNVSDYKTNKKGFIIHGTLGNYDGAINWLCTAPSQRPVMSYSSAHYVIAKDGRITQLAQNDQVTWHAGTVSNPTIRAKMALPTISGVPMVGKYKNPNDSFIGIELEWFTGDLITPQQIASIKQIIASSNIKNPLIFTHSEITDFKADFGRTPYGLSIPKMCA